MLDVIVDRTKWLRGEKLESYLLRASDGKMCCLGFAAKAEGLTDADIEGVPTPEDLDVRGKMLMLLRPVDFTEDARRNNTICNAMIRTNDDPKISDEYREEDLIKYGREVGINFTFVN